MVVRSKPLLPDTSRTMCVSPTKGGRRENVNERQLELCIPKTMNRATFLILSLFTRVNPPASRTFVVLGSVGHKGVRLIPHLRGGSEPKVSCDFVYLDAGSLLRFGTRFERDIGALARQLTHALALDGGALEKEDYVGEDQAGKEGGEREYIDG